MIKANKSIVLLVNLGSPDELSTNAISRFLSKFLTDKRVINLPRILWYPILFGLIIPTRSQKLLKQYKKIWHGSGKSPLVYYTETQSQQLSQLILDSNIIVKHAFCYSTPGISEVLTQIQNDYEVKSLLVIPLYPQFSSTTTLAVFDQITRFYKNKYYLPMIKFINEFYANMDYIQAIVNKIRVSWEINGRADKLIFSYHSLPKVIINKGDVYYEQCLATVRNVVSKLELNKNEYAITFQSKFGRQEWLSPATSDKLMEYARQNLSVDIVCPGFLSDCLETLEEINITNRKLFLKNGGAKYTYIRCLNADMELTKILYELVNI